MESCQENAISENNMNSLNSAIMDWTAVFVRFGCMTSIISPVPGVVIRSMNLMLHIHYRGPCEVSDVSDLMQMTPAGASQMVERLVQQGLVTRQEVSGDRRVRLVHLTDQGKQAVQDCICIHENWVHKLANSLTMDQQNEASSLLRLLTEKANQLNLGD